MVVMNLKTMELQARKRYNILMSLKQIHKKTLIIFLFDVVFFVAMFSVMQGGFPPKFFPERAQTEVLLRPTADEKTIFQNIMVDDLIFSAEENQLFRAGQKIKISCITKNLDVEKPYNVVIKTAKEEILRKTIEPKKGEQNFILNTTYIPNDMGLSPIACRADFDNTIEESDERDNRIVKYLMIF